jgi:hypothetical protein
LGESKVIAARAEVDSARLMRQAADILASPAAMQIRQLEACTLLFLLVLPLDPTPLDDVVGDAARFVASFLLPTLPSDMASFLLPSPPLPSLP